jgi:hypothetical protein
MSRSHSAFLVKRRTACAILSTIEHGKVKEARIFLANLAFNSRFVSDVITKLIDFSEEQVYGFLQQGIRQCLRDNIWSLNKIFLRVNR